MKYRNLRRGLGRASDSLRSVSKVARGMATYLWRGEVGFDTWEEFLRLHCRTNGWSTEILRRVARRLKPPAAKIQPFTSILGAFDSAKLNDISEQIRRDGYYIFPNLVPQAICSEIMEKARSTEGWTRWHGEGYETVPVFDPAHPITPRYVMPEAKIWQIDAYQRLVADPLFVNLSQSYFGGMPLLKDISLWWSSVTGGPPDDDAAQLFHFDFEPIPIWLKFFVYLNDVTSTSGPHVFVKGSHRLRHEKAGALIRRGYVRISDEEIAATFGKENLIELTGRAGTVFVADTMGFHKGKLPEAGERVVAQIQYAMPFFVPVRSNPLPLPRQLEPGLVAARAAYPWAFARYPLST